MLLIPTYPINKQIKLETKARTNHKTSDTRNSEPANYIPIKGILWAMNITHLLKRDLVLHFDDGELFHVSNVFGLSYFESYTPALSVLSRAVNDLKNRDGQFVFMCGLNGFFT
jgi:hypothetical protein